MCKLAVLLVSLFQLLLLQAKPDCSQDSTLSNTQTCLDDAPSTANDSYECSLYVAPSSIPGAGSGLFITRDVEEGEGILPGSDAPSIVICDIDSYGISTKDYVHHAYYWSGGGLASFECDSVSESVVSFGAMSNYHTSLYNIKGYVEPYDDTASNRFSNPGAGAFSYYGGHHFKASRNIDAGEEIFADYGQGWLDGREGTFADNVPREDDFNKAGSILGIIRKLTNSETTLDDEILTLIQNVTEAFSGRVASLLPNTMNEFENLAKGTFDEDVKAIVDTTVTNRNVKWIKEHGVCMEYISPGKSTIPEAGKGAFSKTSFKNGDLIAPAPLLQIMDRDFMYIYEDDKSTEEPSGQQILLNYCFGHKDSKLLLCPQSNIILINHCSKRKVGDGECSDKGPNAKIQWASGWDADTPLWLEMSLEELATATADVSRGLSMEVIATRDIKAGEEVRWIQLACDFIHIMKYMCLTFIFGDQSDFY